MSQVKNLRAMFENKVDDTAGTPDRGRSPGVSTPTPSDVNRTSTESPRPLSRVRTSFVTVEKDGRVGLRRNPSDDSSISRRRPSNETEADSVSNLADRLSQASLDEPVRSSWKPNLAEAIPESPKQPSTAEMDKLHERFGAVTDKPSVNPDKHVDEEESDAALQPADPAPSKTTAAEISNGARTNATKPRSAAATKQSTPATAKAASKLVTTTTRAAARTSTKPATSTRASTTETKKSQLKPASKPTTASAPKREVTAASRVPGAAMRPTASSAAKKPTKMGTKSDTGFVKPAPKSPTKPVKLPPGLMAHTASSVSKGSANRQSLGPDAPVRASSRASMPGAAASKATRPRPSNVTSSRPSIGPPPKKANQSESSTGSRASNVDEGFLARMMRPTQASASKTSEKGPTTPPKRLAARPSVVGSTNSSRRESSVRSMISNRSSLAQHSIREAVEEHPEPAPVPEVASKAAEAETAEEVVDLAKDADLVQPLVEPESAPVGEEHEEEHAKPDAANPAAEPQMGLEREEDEVHEEDGHEDVPAEEEIAAPEEETAAPEEVAPETAQVETAEQVIDLAERADLVQTPVADLADGDLLGAELLAEDQVDDPEPEEQSDTAQGVSVDMAEDVDQEAVKSLVTDVDAASIADEQSEKTSGVTPLDAAAEQTSLADGMKKGVEPPKHVVDESEEEL